jgi:two-component system, chemotaxis family, chemotaxis protein CheY
MHALATQPRSVESPGCCQAAQGAWGANGPVSRPLFSRVHSRRYSPLSTKREIVWGVFLKVPSLAMIVDDDAIIRRMVREVFEAENWEVLDAANGAEGVQKAQLVKPGVIILDLSMPVMNGLDAARELKVLMPYIPLLMFTNNAAAIVEKEARSAGISAVISKSDPDGLKQLLARAKALLGQDGAGAQCAS